MNIISHRTRHARLRAMERYGMVLSEQDVVDIADMCLDGRASALYRQSKRVIICTVRYRQKKLRPVVDTDDRIILTFLPF